MTAMDHNGQEYPTLKAMAQRWGIPYQTLLDRLDRGWDVHRALVTPTGIRRPRQVTDHTGRKFPSLTAMARAWGMETGQVGARLSMGWSVERALTTPLGRSGSRKGAAGRRMLEALRHTRFGEDS